MKINPISFTGMKNTAYEHIWDSECGSELFVLNTQFTDDYNGKDLTEYRKMINRAGSTFRNDINPNFMNVTFIRTPERRGDVYYELFLNGKAFERTDKNLHIFDFIARTAEKLLDKKPSEFVTNKDYLESEDFSHSIIWNADLKEIYQNSGYNDYHQHVREMHDPEFVKIGAKAFKSCLNEIMVDYFA